MFMLFIDILGWITAVLTILLYLPLVAKTIKNKNTEGVSKTTFLVVLLAGILFVIWGGSQNIAPTIMANFAIGILMLPMLFLLLKSKIMATIISVGTISLLIGGTLLERNLLNIKIDKDWFNTKDVAQLIIVIFASIFLAFSWGPQVFMVIKDKTHSTKNLSIIGLIFGTIADVLWIIFFVLKLTPAGGQAGDPGIIVAIASTALMLVMLLILMYFKIYNIIKSHKTYNNVKNID